MTGAANPAKVYTGATIQVSFDSTRCLHFAECVRELPLVFDTKQRPWIQPDNAAADEVATVVERCPSGALQYLRQDGQPERAPVPTTVTRVPDGPLLLHGDLRLLGEPDSGAGISETRLAACACGRSAHRLRCDNSCKG